MTLRKKAEELLKWHSRQLGWHREKLEQWKKFLKDLDELQTTVIPEEDTPCEPTI